MSEEQALYVRDGDAFVGTACTKGSWHDDGQSGGAVLALLGHVLEDVPCLTEMSLSRLTVDIVRPVPVGQRLHVRPTIVREGKKIQVVDFVVTTGETEHVRARALRLRDADLTGIEGMPVSTTDRNPTATLPAPHELEGVDHHPGVADFLRLGAELRRSVDLVDGQYAVWVRLRVPVVASEPVRTTSRTALPMDCVNLIGVAAREDRPMRASAINADVTAHVVRAPVGEWVALTGHTYFAHGVGHGLSQAVMSDVDGVIGVTSTSQLVQPLD